jgi:hypothetical protein
MIFWSGEIKDLEQLCNIFKGHLPEIVKELEQLIGTQDPNVVMLYSRRCLEVIITDLCENELKRPRKTEPLKGIIDKLNSDEKVPPHIVTSMHSLNSLSTYGTHPKDFDPAQVKPVLNNLAIIIRWYLKYKDFKFVSKNGNGEGKYENVNYDPPVKKFRILKILYRILLTLLLIIIITISTIYLFRRNISNHEPPALLNNPTVTFNITSEFGDFNDSIKQKLIREGYILTTDNPEYTIEIISDPHGDPVAINGKADGFLYFFKQDNIWLRINKQPPFRIDVLVPETAPKGSFQEARDEYRKNYKKSIDTCFEEVYNQIKKHVQKK